MPAAENLPVPGPNPAGRPPSAAVGPGRSAVLSDAGRAAVLDVPVLMAVRESEAASYGSGADGRTVRAAAPVRDAVPRPRRDRGTALTGAALVALAGLAWIVLLSRPAGAVGGPAVSPFWGDPRAYVASAAADPAARAEIPGGCWDCPGRLHLRFRSASAPPATEADGLHRTAPDPPVAGHRGSEDLREVLAGQEQAERLLADRALGALPAPSPAGPRPPDPRPPLLVATAIAGPPALALASFLASWALVVLAVVLPAAIPTLAAYGAAHRASFGTPHAAPHAALFALAAAGLWLVAGLAVYLASLAVAAGRGATAASVPDLLALGLGAVAFYRLSPAGEACRVATRRPASVWARRASRGYHGTLAVGWAHAVGSVGAGAAPVAVLAVGGAASPWAIVVAVLLVGERVLRYPERTGLVASGLLLALAGAAAVWPAPALAALRWTTP